MIQSQTEEQIDDSVAEEQIDDSVAEEHIDSDDSVAEEKTDFADYLAEEQTDSDYFVTVMKQAQTESHSDLDSILMMNLVWIDLAVANLEWNLMQKVMQ